LLSQLTRLLSIPAEITQQIEGSTYATLSLAYFLLFAMRNHLQSTDYLKEVDISRQAPTASALARDEHELPAVRDCRIEMSNLLVGRMLQSVPDAVLACMALDPTVAPFLGDLGLGDDLMQMLWFVTYETCLDMVELRRRHLARAAAAVTTASATAATTTTTSSTQTPVPTTDVAVPTPPSHAAAQAPAGWTDRLMAQMEERRTKRLAAASGTAVVEEASLNEEVGAQSTCVFVLTMGWWNGHTC